MGDFADVANRSYFDLYGCYNKTEGFEPPTGRIYVIVKNLNKDPTPYHSINGFVSTILYKRLLTYIVTPEDRTRYGIKICYKIADGSKNALQLTLNEAADVQLLNYAPFWTRSFKSSLSVIALKIDYYYKQ